jgi:hypothetical protein
VCVCVRACVRACVCVCACVCARVRVRSRPRAFTCMQESKYVIYVCIYVFICRQTGNADMHTHRYVCIIIHTYIYFQGLRGHTLVAAIVDKVNV